MRGDSACNATNCGLPLQPRERAQPDQSIAQQCPAATPRHATPRHATPRHATPRHATPRHAAVVFTGVSDKGDSEALRKYTSLRSIVGKKTFGPIYVAESADGNCFFGVGRR